MKYVAIGVAALVVILVIAVIVLAGVAKRQTKKALEAARVAEIEKRNAEFEKKKNQIMHEVVYDSNKKKNKVLNASSDIDKFNAATAIMRNNKS